MDKMTNHQRIASCLFSTLYQSPESLKRKKIIRFGLKWKVSNTERRLREMREKDMAESKEYPNETNHGWHLRWKLKEQ
jgi:hypothetical protein